MSLSTYLLEYGRHVARLRRRRRRRAYAPTSNTASHDNHKKILHEIPFLSRDDYGAPLGGPSGRRSSAIKWINLVNVLFIGFVKFETKQWFSAYQDQFCVWLSLARLWTAQELFSEPFSKKEMALCFFFLLDSMLLVPVKSLNNSFLYLSFAQLRKVLSKFSKLSTNLKHRGKNFVLMESIVHLSSNGS